MKRRGLLFGLFAAPLVPVTAASAARDDAAELLRALLSLTPNPWTVRCARSYSQAQLMEWFKECPEVMALDAPPPSWRTDWRFLIQSLINRPLCFSGEAPVGTPVPHAINESGWRPWFDRRGVEILRVREQASTTPSDSSEAFCTEPSDSDCAGSDR